MDPVREKIASASEEELRATLLLVCDGIDRMAIASVETALELNQLDDSNEARKFVLSIEDNFRGLIKGGLGIK
jgi:hypothetical protein